MLGGVTWKILWIKTKVIWMHEDIEGKEAAPQAELTKIRKEQEI